MRVIVPVDLLVGELDLARLEGLHLPVDGLLERQLILLSRPLEL